MSTSRLFMVRISTGAEPFEATARCVEHEPIRHFTDPLQLLEFLRRPDGVAARRTEAKPVATRRPVTLPTNPFPGELP